LQTTLQDVMCVRVPTTVTCADEGDKSASEQQKRNGTGGAVSRAAHRSSVEPDRQSESVDESGASAADNDRCYVSLSQATQELYFAFSSRVRRVYRLLARYCMQQPHAVQTACAIAAGYPVSARRYG